MAISSRNKDSDKQYTGPFRYIRRMWAEGALAYLVGGFALGLLTRSVIDQLNNAGITGFLGDLVPEGVGILFTVLFLNRLNEIREEQRRIEDTKERLIREAGSASNSVTKAAISDIYARGWLDGESGILAKQSLHYSDLRGANLYYANLERTDLRRADLRGADLIGAKLVQADLRGANLTDAKLYYINPKDPNDVRRADFTAVACSDETVLPDGTFWHPDIDWEVYGVYINKELAMQLADD